MSMTEEAEGTTTPTGRKPSRPNVQQVPSANDLRMAKVFCEELLMMNPELREWVLEMMKKSASDALRRGLKGSNIL